MLLAVKIPISVYQLCRTRQVLGRLTPPDSTRLSGTIRHLKLTDRPGTTFDQRGKVNTLRNYPASLSVVGSLCLVSTVCFPAAEHHTGVVSSFHSESVTRTRLASKEDHGMRVSIC